MTACHPPRNPQPTPVADSEVAEVTLLLSADQLAELERLARRRGVTVGQLLRRQVTALLEAGEGADRARSGEPGA